MAGRSSRSASRTPARSLSDEGENREKPKKRRKLERKTPGKASSKYKSAEVVVESESDEASPAEASTPAGNDKMEDEDMLDQENEVPRRQPGRQRHQLRRIADDDDDEDEDEDGLGRAASIEKEDDDGSANADIASAAMAAMGDDVSGSGDDE